MSGTNVNSPTDGWNYSSAGATLLQAATGVPAYSHIVVVVMENHGYSQIIGDTTDAPYIHALASGGALLSNYTAITHPSEPNYFALYAGSTFGISDDNRYTEPDPTLATILQAAGKTFTGYVEGGDTSYDHNPWESFPEGLSVEKDFSTFPSASNFASLPTVSFVIPNVNDDMHNGTIAQGDAWLQANLGAYALWAQTNNSLLVVTWDENDGSPGNQVATILSGAQVNPGIYNTAYNHYDLLSTILGAYDLTGPNNAATAPPIGDGVFSSVVCFASGTRILTANGEVAVEALREGDLVAAHRSGETALEPVRWIGRRMVDLAAHPRPWLAAPIRIRRGAFTDTSPHRDLVVSPDHALYIDGVLIPAKLLANDATIAQEMWSSVEYFHVELEGHGVLLAEGLPVESYLDTGNRALFENAGVALMLHPEFTVNAGLKCWQRDACARLAVDEATVEPVWRCLSERAEALGHPRPCPANTTREPDLRLLVDREVIRPVSAEGRRCAFVLPRGASHVRLLSRVGWASNERPWLEDRRRLGVAIGRIVLHANGASREIALDDPSLSDGWWTAERDATTLWRWTDGAACIPLHLPADVMELHITGTLPYRTDTRRPDAVLAA